MLTYLNFDLVFERAEQGYRVEASGPDGRHATTFQVPTTTTELENLVLRIGRTRHAMRRIDPPEIEAAKRFGERLFDAIFKEDVGTTFRRSLAQAEEQQAGLRVRVRLTRTPELANLPWEYLYDRDVNRFLALSTETPLVRFLDIPERIRPLTVQLPLRALAIIANPRGQVPLHVEREWANIQTALGDLIQRGALELERLERPTMSALQRRLRQKSYHILHFIGHGAFEQRLQDGVLMLEDVQGDEYRVSGQEIGMLLHDHRSLRMVLLNVCEGGRSASDDPFAGVAQSLVQQGVPAVIAMQFEVSDEAAIALAHEFYSAVTDGYPVDAALAEARKSVFAQGYRLEWGTPVLYLRSHDGQIFETGASSPGATSPTSQAHRQVEQAYTEALALFYTRQWEAAITAFERVLQLDPDQPDASAKLKQAQREQELAGRYAAAQQAIEAQQWAQALTELNAVAAIDPDYRDVEALARNAQRRKQLAELGSEALALFRAQSWQAVLNVVDRMRTVDPEINEYDEIAETSRQKLLEQEQSERVAALYNDGLALMRDGQWPQALECFEEIERRVPGYQQTPALLQRVREELGAPAAVINVETPTTQETRAMSLRARLAAHYFGGTLFSIVLNIGLGHAMWSLGRVPLYLDTLGTIIVGLVFGPWVGLVSGLVSHFVWPLFGLESGTFAGSFAYLVGLVGLIAGFVGRSGLLSRRLPPWLAAIVGTVIAVGLGYCIGVAFNGPYEVSNTFRQYPWLTNEFAVRMPIVIGVAIIGAALGWWRRPQVFTAGLTGLATGVVTVLCSIPIAAHVFYGSSSEWADVLNGSWIENIPSTAGIILPAGLYADGGISDPLDKLFSFMLAYYAVRAIPERWLARLGVAARKPRA